MPRPIRIQYESAYYHVMNRGRGRQAIFYGEDYYQAFLKTLEEAHDRFDAIIHAYCLMNNHYHLLIETPRANLDRIMRHINGVYTQRFNRLKKTDGPLFRGRYKAILVDKDAYLLQLSRYIHRNPAEIKGESEEILNHYQWSSYLAYTNKVKSPTWLMRETTYQMLGKKQRCLGYQAYVKKGVDNELLQYYSKGNIAAILGDTEFRESIAEKKEEIKYTGDISKALSIRPELSSIVKVVAEIFKVSKASILKKQNGRQKINIPRKFAMYCCQQIGDMTLNEIMNNFNLSNL